MTMAQPQSRQIGEVGFTTIELFKDQTLGIGSYGAVCKAKCDDLLCAAKILHPTLFDPTAHQEIAPHREHRLPFSRFQQECEFMSAIRHPNIVQYLGTCQDPETRLPVLLMELMDDSLTHFLESSQEPLSYHTQLNFCHDIAQALSFLHSNAIIHRDLSSNNVLLIGDIRAKVTDFGMAKLGDINPRATHISLTMCPGTDVYMPPEVIKENPVHTVKIDSFSFGVLVVQILTRQFPNPGDRVKTICTIDPQYPTIQVVVSETERRQNHISQVDPNHPFQPIALDCLKDEEMDRPSAQELCTRIAALKETPQYGESVRIAIERTTSNRLEGGRTDHEREEQIRKQLRQKNEVISAKEREIWQLRQHSQQIQGLQQVLESCLQEKEKTIVFNQRKIGQLRQKVDQQQKQITSKDKLIREKDELIREKEKKFQKQRETNQLVITQFQTQIHELETQLSRREHQHQSLEPKQRRQSPQNLGMQRHDSGTNTRRAEYHKEIIDLSWRAAKKAPCKTYRDTDAVVCGTMVYLRQGGTQHIYAYNSVEDSWNQIPDCLTELCTLVVVDSLLTTIGGYRGGSRTNQLFSLTGEGYRKKWTEVFPPMPTKRSTTVAVCTGTTLIIAGGRGIRIGYLTTVEVLNTETRQWSTASDLPGPLGRGSAIVCGDRIYMLGGWSGTPIKSVYTCSVSALLQSSRITVKKSLPSSAEHVWTNNVAELPIAESTCVSLNGRLLAIGGEDSFCNPIATTCAAVYMYNPTSNTWEVISHMTIARRLCLAAVLPNNKLMVVGGYTTTRFDSETDCVEVAIEVCVH